MIRGNKTYVHIRGGIRLVNRGTRPFSKHLLTKVSEITNMPLEDYVFSRFKELSLIFYDHRSGDMRLGIGRKTSYLFALKDKEITIGEHENIIDLVESNYKLTRINAHNATLFCILRIMYHKDRKFMRKLENEMIE